MDGADPIGLAVDLSAAGRVRIAAVSAASGAIGQIETRADNQASTLTEVFLNFERQLARPLRGAQAVIAIAGVASGDVISVKRSRWTLSRTGLNAFFGRPVLILNEVAARAWGALARGATTTPVGGSSAPEARATPQRRAIISLEDGLGVAIVDRDTEGGTRVIETEAGHLGFSPRETADDAIVAAIRRTGRPLSWERAIDLVRGDEAPGLAAAKSEREALLARLLADFVQSVALAGGAWDGVYVTGRAFASWTERTKGGEVLARIRRHPVFPREFGALNCWVLQQPDAVLQGCAELIRTRAATFLSERA